MSREPDKFIASRSAEYEFVNNLNNLFFDLMKSGIADLHMIEKEDHWELRVRTPVGLEKYKEIGKQEGTLYSDKIKARCNISTSERIKPADGRLRLRFNLDSEVHKLDVRVNISFSVRGEYIVCRLLDQKNASVKLESLGLPEHYAQTIKHLMSEPNGLFLISGPTGSGKTTTLYAILNLLNDGTNNILTIENPVEYMVEGIQQFNVDGRNLTFEQQLRAAMRQDPDVILIGEIRDKETANVAIQAALTGHLVLSTVHSNSALATVDRMLDFGVDPASLALVLNGVVAQRLLPKIDTSVGIPEMIEPTEIESLWLDLCGVASENIKIPNPEHPTKGKQPVMELFIFGEKEKLALAKGAREKDLQTLAIMQPWYDTLAQSGSRLVFNGMAHLSHLKKIASGGGGADKQHKRILSRLVESGEITMSEAHRAVEMQTELKLKGINKPISDVLALMREQDTIAKMVASGFFVFEDQAVGEVVLN